MTVHLPIHLAPPAADWQPRESVSPTQLANYDRCVRQWVLGSVWGVRPRKKSKGAMFGAVIHACLEAYLQGRTVNDPQITPSLQKELEPFTQAERDAMIADAPRRALAGLHLLPPLSECDEVETEVWIGIDSRRLWPDMEPLRVNGKIDLRVKRAGARYTYDHKSTKGGKPKGKPWDPWLYVKKPEDVASDPQGVFYALDGIHKHNLDSIWNRWVYYLTDPDHHPQATHIDFQSHRADVEYAARGWLMLGNQMRGIVRNPPAALEDIPPPAKLPPDPDSPCLAFGGCPYRIERGGPCNPYGSAVNFGDMILTGLVPEKDEANQMDLNEKIRNTRSSNGASPLIPPEAYIDPAPAAYMAPPGSVTTAVVPMAAPAPMAPTPVQRPPAPAGWEYDANGALVPVRQPLPDGWTYNAAGVPVPVTAPAVSVDAPAAAVAPTVAVIEAVAAEVAEVVATAAAETAKRGRGRPRKAAQVAAMPSATADGIIWTAEALAAVNKPVTAAEISDALEDKGQPERDTDPSPPPSGLSDRDMFAMAALSGLLANPANANASRSELTREAYLVAGYVEAIRAGK